MELKFLLEYTVFLKEFWWACDDSLKIPNSQTFFCSILQNNSNFDFEIIENHILFNKTFIRGFRYLQNPGDYEIFQILTRQLKIKIFWFFSRICHIFVIPEP